MTARLITTRHTAGQLRATLVRIAHAESQIDAYHRPTHRLEMLAALLRPPSAVPGGGRLEQRVAASRPADWPMMSPATLPSSYIPAGASGNAGRE